MGRRKAAACRSQRHQNDLRYSLGVVGEYEMTKSISDYVSLIAHDDWQMLARVLGSYRRIFMPDVVISPDGNPYLFRWYLMNEKNRGSVMIHMQVASDPERPLHDHPWDNRS